MQSFDHLKFGEPQGAEAHPGVGIAGEHLEPRSELERLLRTWEGRRSESCVILETQSKIAKGQEHGQGKNLSLMWLGTEMKLVRWASPGSSKGHVVDLEERCIKYKVLKRSAWETDMLSKGQPD